MAHDAESLAAALDRLAAELDTVVQEANAAHEQYIQTCHAHYDQRGSLDKVTDEVRHRRTGVSLYAAGQLVEHLRQQAQAAHDRFPDVDATGAHLPPAPPSLEPAVVRHWWGRLPEDEQEDFIVHYPQWVGRADGLPVIVRHRANMMLLEAEIDRRSTLTDPALRAGEEPSEEEQRDLRGLIKLRALLNPALQGDDGRDAAGPKGLEDRTLAALDKVTVPLHERFLYLLDASDYPLKTAIVFGDLEQAPNVVLHVPGATTTVDLRLFREAQWMSNLRAEAARYAGGPEGVAIVDWIGYQAPYDIAVRRALGDSHLPLLMPGEAADDRYARAAQADLIRCAKGVRALMAPHGRLVASGHSYGGSVVGLALAGTDVFDAAMVSGCPGLFTNTLDTLQLPPDVMFVAVSPGDVIPLLGIFGGQILQIPGIRFLSPYARPIVHPDGTRALLMPTFGHESYYNLGTSTLQGFAAVAAGALDRVKTASWLGVQRVARRPGVAVAAPATDDDAGEADPPPV